LLVPWRHSNGVLRLPKKTDCLVNSSLLIHRGVPLLERS